jgi:hypothetical protein
MPMADDEQSTAGMVSGLVQDFIAQLHAVTQGLEDLAGSGARVPVAPGTFPLPGALSAAQLTSIAGSVGAQRRSIEALKAQLSSFDEQLAVLEQILAPLAEWSRTWAELEEQLLNVRRWSAGGNRASGSLPDSSPQPWHLLFSVRCLLDYVRADQRLYHVLFHEAPGHQEQARDPLQHLVVRLLSDAMDQGALTPTDTGVLARFLLDGLHGAMLPLATKTSRASQPASAKSSAASSPRPARQRT